MKQTVIRAIEEHKIIAIVRGVAQDKLIPLTQALYDGGIRLIELTFSADGSISDEQTAARIRLLAKQFAGQMLVGAGTVLTKQQVALVDQAGGMFAISPNTDEDVIHACNSRGLVSIPGAFTPTEIVTAHRVGADFVKLFPVSDLGHKYISAVKAPLPHIRLLAVGGVDETNIANYLQAGACGAGVGGNLVNRKWVEAGDFNKITQVAQQLAAAVK